MGSSWSFPFLPLRPVQVAKEPPQNDKTFHPEGRSTAWRRWRQKACGLQAKPLLWQRHFSTGQHLTTFLSPPSANRSYASCTTFPRSISPISHPIDKWLYINYRVESLSLLTILRHKNKRNHWIPIQTKRKRKMNMKRQETEDRNFTCDTHNIFVEPHKLLNKKKSKVKQNSCHINYRKNSIFSLFGLTISTHRSIQSLTGLNLKYMWEYYWE